MLQGVAWTGMLVTYSRDASLAEAVSRTLDGEHPCALCRAVSRGRALERERTSAREPQGGGGTLVTPRLESVLADLEDAVPPAPDLAGPGSYPPVSRASSRVDSPPVPPPRRDLNSGSRS
ncbi:MAG: hypothetical protein IT580_23405 [Verrucomicrobiales bacterium]|nr:hypothetical protein [Verrucomicrobiales bacterium]